MRAAIAVFEDIGKVGSGPRNDIAGMIDRRVTPPPSTAPSAMGRLAYPAPKEFGRILGHTINEVHVFNGRSSGWPFVRTRALARAFMLRRNEGRIMIDSPKEDDWWVLSNHVDVHDWRESVLSNAFVDAMLLAFIRAHPLMEKDGSVNELDRVRDARLALFGIPAGTRNKYYADYAALSDMAKGYVADRSGEIPSDEHGTFIYEPEKTGCRTLKDLALVALENGLANGGRKEIGTRESSVKRLSRKFAKQFDELIRFAEDDSGAQLIAEKTRQLQVLLGPTSIPMSLTSDFIRDLKEVV